MPKFTKAVPFVPTHRLMTIPEAADYLRKSPRTIEGWLRIAYMPCLRLGPQERKCVRFTQQMIDNWLLEISKNSSQSGRSTRMPSAGEVQ